MSFIICSKHFIYHEQCLLYHNNRDLHHIDYTLEYYPYRLAAELAYLRNALLYALNYDFALEINLN